MDQKSRFTAWSSYVLMFFAISSCWGCSSTNDSTVRAWVPSEPLAVRSERTYNIAYEVVLSDYTSKGLVLQRIEVYFDNGASPARAYSRADIEACNTFEGVCLYPPASELGPVPSSDITTRVPHPVLAFWLKTDDNIPLPQTIRSVLFFSHSPAAGSESGYAAAVQASTRVIREDPILITPPLRGNRWAALGSNGLPYALSVFHMLGTINVYDLENPFDAIWKLLTVPTDHAGQIPEHGAVVQLQ